MAEGDTDKVIRVLGSNPLLVMEFMADLGGDPEQYGGLDLTALTPEIVGRALVGTFLAESRERDQELDEQLGDVDLGAVDHVAVGNHLEASLTDEIDF